MNATTNGGDGGASGGRMGTIIFRCGGGGGGGNGNGRGDHDMTLSSPLDFAILVSPSPSSNNTDNAARDGTLKWTAILMPRRRCRSSVCIINDKHAFGEWLIFVGTLSQLFVFIFHFIDT